MAFTATDPLPGVLLVGPKDALAQLNGPDIGELASADQFTAARIRSRLPGVGPRDRR